MPISDTLDYRLDMIELEVQLQFQEQRLADHEHAIELIQKYPLLEAGYYRNDHEQLVVVEEIRHFCKQMFYDPR